MKKFLQQFLLPEQQLINDLNNVETALLHQKIIEKNPFLKKLYYDFYQHFLKEINKNPAGKYLEIGSGGGFLKQLCSNIITSDVIQLPGLDIYINATSLPFKNNSLDGIFMIDTFHHIPDVKKFLAEASRCLKPYSNMIMTEPANTLFSRFIYQNFHHEPFNPNSEEWTFPSDGPMSSSNQALPWIVFKRDQELFFKKFPQLKLVSYKNHTPLRYLLSGGLTLKQRFFRI